MAEIVLAVASKVAEYLVAPVGRQCGYVIFSDSHVRQLEDEVGKLGDASLEVQHRIDEAERNMKPIEARVEKWVKEADTVANTVRSMLDNDGRAKKTCFCGWLPNPKERYSLGRDARKTVQAIQALILQGNFERVYYDGAPPGLVGDASNVNLSVDDGGNTITDSRTSIFQGIMEALDDEKHKVIGVYGPGGVGKTTLLEEVEKKLRKEGRPFHMIVKSKVSQNPDLKKIQDDIAYAFHLNLKDEPSEVGRRDLLFKRLQKDPSEKVLVVLDDLWDKLDLKAVGIPSRDESMGCKLLLTSRFKDVLEQKMLADRTFCLEGLNKDEAFRLFEKTVGDRLEDEELKRIAPKVVKKLAGLPLLINSIASTLKYSHVYAWKKALRNIDESNIGTIVKLSYDHLESEDAKSLFLLCGLIGGTIQVETLFVLGMGLGLFEGFNKTIEDSRDELRIVLGSLHSICLLHDGDNDKENVTIHDLYSEVVVSTPFRGENSLMMNSNYGSQSKEKLEKCWAICLVDVGNDRFVDLTQCVFPELKILMLSQPNNWKGRPAHQYGGGDCCRPDFSHMKKLQVLYLCSMYITTLPSSIEILWNLLSLYLDHCDVGDVAILGKLKALKILSFAGSTISRLPKEIGDLRNLRLLNLSNCDKLQTIEPGVLKGLINLEELYLRRSFDRWMGKNEIPSESCNARLVELNSLTKIASLEISIPDPTILLEDDDFPFGNLIRFWINIGNAKGRTIGGLRTMMLKLEEWDSILSKDWVQKLLQKTQYLHLDGLKEFKKNTNELCTQGFRELKHLDIVYSPTINYIANSSHGLPLTASTILEPLWLDYLINLEKICNSRVTPECFSKLKVVRIEHCHRLKNLWFLSEMQRLVHLEDLRVRECHSMQAIITDGAREVEVVADDIVELPNLRILDLAALPKMTSFCTGAEGAPIRVSLPRLESLQTNGLLGLEEILYSDPSMKYNNLKSVFIFDCPSLKSLFDCGSLDENTEQTIVLLPKLEIVKVHRARKLRCMVESDSQMIWCFPSLKEVDVADCSNMRYLFPNFIATTLTQLEKICISHCEQMKEVVLQKGGGQSEADVMNFRSLVDLRIRDCPNLGAFIRSPTRIERQLGEMVEENNESSQSLFNEMVTFPNIRNLLISGLQCKELWNNQIHTDSFSKLESLGLGDCNNLQRVASSHMWKRLQRCLEKLKVISCHSIEIIYEGDGTDTEGGKLGWLVLRDLENLRCIWQSDGLPNIPFPNLRDVEARRCPRLEMLFTTFTAKFLEQIEELVVESCEDMELIAGHEKGEEGSSTAITFSKLTLLRLSKLPKFKNFLPDKYSLKFPCPEDFPSLEVWSRESCGEEPDQIHGSDWKGCQYTRQDTFEDLLDWEDYQYERQMDRLRGKEDSWLKFHY